MVFPTGKQWRTLNYQSCVKYCLHESLLNLNEPIYKKW